MVTDSEYIAKGEAIMNDDPTLTMLIRMARKVGIGVMLDYCFVEGYTITTRTGKVIEGVKGND